MPTVTRMEAGESLERASKPSRASIRYLVQGGAYTSNAAITAVQDDTVNGIAIGDVHPEAAELTATRFSASERAGAGTDRSWFVDVEFGLNGAGANFEEPPTTEPTYSTIEFSMVDKDFKGPYWIREPIVGVSPDGVLSTTYKWEERLIEFRVSALQLRVVTNVTSDPNQSQNPYMLSNWVQNNAQVNKIHNMPVGGTFQWQYLGADSSQIAPDIWRVTHQWWSDPGNEPIPLPDGINPSETVTFDSQREPFTDYQSYKISVDETIPSVGPVWLPVVSTYEPFVADPTGYTKLVGWPFNGAI